MSDEQSRMRFTRRKLLGSLAVTGLATAGAGAGTFAYLQDDESVDNNSVQAGTMDLTLTDGSTIYWNVSGAAPGGPASESQEIVLHNVGSVSADHVDFEFSNTTIEDDDGDADTGDNSGPDSDTAPSDGQNGDMSQYVRVQDMSYDPNTGNSGDTIYLVNSTAQPVSVGGRTDLTDVNKNGYIDLQDLADSSNQAALSDFQPPEPNDATQSSLQITVDLHSSTPNNYQGDRVETALTAKLKQESH